MHGVRGEAHHLYGKSHSEETKNKIRMSVLKYYDEKVNECNYIIKLLQLAYSKF